MHSVDIWPLDRSGDPKQQCQEPSLILGYLGEQLVKITPQISGCNPGLTIETLDGTVVLQVQNQKKDNRLQPAEADPEVLQRLKEM